MNLVRNSFLKAIFFVIAFQISLFAFHRRAEAARLGYVSAEVAEVYQGPGKAYPMLGKLPHGTKFVAGNLPTNGFYKIKTVEGLIAWIYIDSISFATVSSKLHTAPKTSAHSDVVRRPPGDFRLRGLVTFNYFSAAGLNSMLGFSSLKTAIGYGLEGWIPLSDRFAGMFRIEMISRGIVAVDSSSPFETYQLGFSSYPLMVGAEYSLYSDRDVFFGVGAMVGLGLGTSFSAVDLQQQTPNATFWSGMALAGLLRTNLEWQFTKGWTLMAELGFRYLQASAPQPSVVGNGGTRFQASGAFVPLTLSMTGFEGGLGISYGFK